MRKFLSEHPMFTYRSFPADTGRDRGVVTFYCDGQRISVRNAGTAGVSLLPDTAATFYIGSDEGTTEEFEAVIDRGTHQPDPALHGRIHRARGPLHGGLLGRGNGLRYCGCGKQAGRKSQDPEPEFQRPGSARDCLTGSTLAHPVLFSRALIFFRPVFLYATLLSPKKWINLLILRKYRYFSKSLTGRYGKHPAIRKEFQGHGLPEGFSRGKEIPRTGLPGGSHPRSPAGCAHPQHRKSRGLPAGR